MDDCVSHLEKATTTNMSPKYKELCQNRNIPHAVLMREYGLSRCPSRLSAEFRIAAEGQLISKEHKEMKCELPDFTRSTYLMVFSPDGKKMASSHGNHNVYVTDVKTGKNLNTLSGHPRTPWCIAFHPSSNQILASGCLGGQVRVWDLHGGSEVWTVEGQTSIASLAFHPSDRLLVIASYNEIYFWDWSQPEPFARSCTLNEKEKIRYVAFDYSGSKLVTGIEIPKPLMSQWDRVGPGGQANRSAGPSAPRISGLRPGFGTVFSRPSQGPGPGPGSGPPSSLRPSVGLRSNPNSGPTSVSVPRPPTSSTVSTFNLLQRGSSTQQLEGRIRQNVQLLQLLLDARRNARQELNMSTSRRSVNIASPSVSNTASYNNGSSGASNIISVGAASGNVGTTSATSNTQQLTNLSPETPEEQQNLNQIRNPSTPTWGSNGPQSSFRSEQLSSTRPTVIRNSTTQSSVLMSPSNSINSTFRGIPNRTLSSERLPNFSGIPTRINPFLRNERLNSTRAPNLRNLNLSGFSRQSFSSSVDSDLTNQFNHLSEEIRQTLYTLSDHVDNMQHCPSCLPRMTSSRLSHIQQLWAELRDQIRSLQSSIWENTTLASNAWHRSSFEVISEMLSNLTHGSEEGPSERASENSHTTATRPVSHVNERSPNTQCWSISNSSSNSSLSEDSSLRGTPSTGNSSDIRISSRENSESFALSSSHSADSSSLSSSVNSPARSSTAPCSTSSLAGSANSQSSQRGNTHRNLTRSNPTRRLLYLRCQNGLARRVGSTAGALRSQRPSSGRTSQSISAEVEARPQPLLSERREQMFGDGRERLVQSESQGTATEPASNLRAADDSLERNDQIHQGTTRNLSHNNRGTPSENVDQWMQMQCQLMKYRLFGLGRRRNSSSRPLRSSAARGTARPHRATPPRFFGGRRSILEVAADPATSHSQEQPARNPRANIQSSVRTSDNMLMRIFRSLRRAASLSGRSDQQTSHEAQGSQPSELQPSGAILPEQSTTSLNGNSSAASGPRHTSVDFPIRENTTQGMRPWTQFSGPEGDLLHIGQPQLERVDPAVQQRLLRIHSSGTMNVVQDGLMTEELATNLLRLHLHQQHQEFQLRHHQARLRVRYQNQTSLQNPASGQVQRDVSRRLAHCSLCGGSIYISSHFLVRVGTPPQDPPPAHVTSNTTPVWQRWAAPTPTPPPPPPPAPAHAPPSPISSSPSHPARQQEAQESSLSPPPPPPPPPPQPPRAVYQSTLHVPSQKRQHIARPAHPPLQPPMVRSDPEPNLPNEHTSVNPRVRSSSRVRLSPLPEATQTSTRIQSPPLAPLIRSQSLIESPQSSSRVLSPPQLLLGPSASPSSLTQLSPSSPSTLQPPHSPVVSQVSTQTNPRYFGTNSLSNPVGLSSNGNDYPGSGSLFWQVPASHHRHHVNQRVPQLQRQQLQNQESPSPAPSSPPLVANPIEGVDLVRRQSAECDAESQAVNLPSTSSGIRAFCKNQGSKRKLLSPAPDDTSSSDSETEGILAHLRGRKSLYIRQMKEKGKHKPKPEPESVSSVTSANYGPVNSNACEAGPSYKSLPTSPEYQNTSCRGQTLKRNVKKGSVENSSDSEGGVTEETTSETKSKRSGLHQKPEVNHKGKETISNTQDPTNQREAGSSLESEPSTSRQEVCPLQQLPEPTFTRQLEAITGRLDHLMFLQRNALDPSQRNRNGDTPDNSPLRNAGDSSHTSQDNNASSDAINVTSRMLTRLTESLSRQIQMVQQVRGQQNNCTEHQDATLRSGSTLQSNFTMINNTRRRGQELLSLMADSLSTFSSYNGPPENFRSNPTFDHVQTISAAFWLLQGLYILLHLALELTDLLLTHYVSSYEPSDPEEATVAPLPQPCVCLNSPATSTAPLLSRVPVGQSPLWNGSNGPTGVSNPRSLGPIMMHSVYESLRSNIRSPRPPFLSARPTLPVSESSFRSRRNVQDETTALAPPVYGPTAPVMPVPSYTSQVTNEASGDGMHPAPATYALVHPPWVHPMASTGTIRRSASQVSRTSAQQYFSQSESNVQAQGSVAPGNTRPGFMRLSHLLHPPLVHQQERPLPSSDADMSAQQSLFFHFDYTRNIGHFVREPNFTTEEHRIHRIQLWDFSKGDIPDITDGDENLVVAECKIHNDASVDISADGHLLVALLPAPRPTANPYTPSTPPGQTIGVYSLVWESLGQLLYTTNLGHPAVSVALSPSAAYLLVGMATRRAMLMPSDQHPLALIFRLEGAKPGRSIGARGRLHFCRDIEAQNENVSVGINCIRWAPVSGQGIVYGTNTGTLVMLR